MGHGDLEALELCGLAAKPQEPRGQAVEHGVLMEPGDLEALEPCAPAAETGQQWAQAVEPGELMEPGDQEVSNRN